MDALGKAMTVAGLLGIAYVVRERIKMSAPPGQTKPAGDPLWSNSLGVTHDASGWWYQGKHYPVDPTPWLRVAP